MATDPDRQSDGRAARRRRRALAELPGGFHAAFQAAWAVAMGFPTAAEVTRVVHDPTAGAALGVIEVTGIWASLAGFGWALRVAALTGCGRWGAKTRRRAREAGRRRGGDR